MDQLCELTQTKRTSITSFKVDNKYRFNGNFSDTICICIMFLSFFVFLIGTPFEQLNRKVEKLVNKTNGFPEFDEILQLAENFNQKQDVFR